MLKYIASLQILNTKYALFHEIEIKKRIKHKIVTVNYDWVFTLRI